MSKLKKASRKTAVSLIGFPLLIVGLIAIPVPIVPGIPIIILALFILSLEYAWAARHLDRAKTAHKKLMEKATGKVKEKQEKLNAKDKK